MVEARGCPDESVLLALVEGTLAPVPIELDAHLDICQLCRELVVLLATSDAQPERSSPFAVPEHGRYEVLGHCGRGGDSWVLRVYDRVLHREVALKTLHVDASPLRHRARLERFVREIRIASSLNHPGIIALYDAGVDDQHNPFYTMPLVSGRTLDQCVEASGTAQDRLRLLPHFVQLCHAVAYANRKGVLHRDIKPHSVMLGTFGETLLLDWGLAQHSRWNEGSSDELSAAATTDEHQAPAGTLQTSRRRTMNDGTFVGTPAYMSPEQAAGDLASLDARSEVWSLGAVLSFILTDETPHTSDPKHLRKAWRTISPELASILGRALASDPDERYDDAEALASDVLAAQTGGVVSAHRYAMRDHVARLARRHPRVAQSLAGAVPVLAIALAVSLVAYRSERADVQRVQRTLAETERARDEVRQAHDARDEQAQLASFHLAQAYAEKAERLRDAKHLLHATTLAKAVLELDPTRLDAPHAVALPKEIRDKPSPSARARSLLLRGQLDPVIERVGRTDLPKALGLLRDVSHGNGGRGVFAALDHGPFIQLLDASTAEVTRTLDPAPEPLEAVVVSPRARFVAARSSARFYVHDLKSGREVARHDATFAWSSGLALSDAGDVAWVSSGLEVRLRRKGQRKDLLLGRLAAPASQLAFLPDEEHLAVGGHDGRTYLFTLDRSRPPKVLATHGVAISALASHGPTLVVGGSDGKLVLVDSNGARIVASWGNHRGSITALAFAQDGRTVYASARDGSVHGFDVRKGERLARLDGNVGVIHELAHDPATDALVAVGSLGTTTWTLRDPSRSLQHRKPSTMRNAMAVAHDGNLLLPRTDAVGWTQLGLADASIRHVELPGASAVLRVQARADGHVFTMHEDGAVIEWADVGRGWSAHRRLGLTAKLGAAFHLSSDGRWLAADAGDGAVALWDTSTDAPAAMLHHHEQRVVGLAFSPDAHLLASAGSDGTLGITRLGEGKAFAPLHESHHPLHDVAFSPDGSVLAVASSRGLHLWSLETWEERQLHAGSHHTLGFSSDARHLAAVSDTGNVTVWSLPEAAVALDIRRTPVPEHAVFAEGALWLIGSDWFEEHPLELRHEAPSPAPAVSGRGPAR